MTTELEIPALFLIIAGTISGFLHHIYFQNPNKRYTEWGLMKLLKAP